jgi:hypothetical protein
MAKKMMKGKQASDSKARGPGKEVKKAMTKNNVKALMKTKGK